MTKKHARKSCSGSKRWIACPGCLNLADKCPTPSSSPFAQEGTNAHYLAEVCLNADVDADRYIDEELHDEDGKPFTATDEMAIAVQVYLDAVRECAFPSKTHRVRPTLLIEAKFTLEWINKEMFGTNDALVYDPDTKRLTIFDYKHGQGIVVEPEWNSQLMMYGLGGIHKLWSGITGDKPMPALKLVETVELVIVQPRAFHPDGSVRRWEISAKDLFFWGLQVLKPASIATEDPDAPLKAGSYCKSSFCPALAVCPAVLEKAMAVAKTQFSDPILPEPSSLTPEEIVKVLEVSDVFSEWAKEVKSFASGQMKAGVALPGFKLVKRQSKRKWLDEDRALEAIEPLLGDEAFKKKVLTMPQAEKALKKLGHSPEAELSGLWIKPDTGVTMAPESDKRKAVAPPAVNEFIEHADFLQ